MRITLYLKNKIMQFILPTDISGSYSFDEKEDEESKLINIEAVNNEWQLYSTNDVTIEINNQTVQSTVIKPNNFYFLKRLDVTYIIYISDSYEKIIMPYNYDQEINLIVGNAENCNIRYNIPFLKDATLNIKYEENRYIIENLSNVPIYINNLIMESKVETLKYGDNIHLFGLNITLLNKVLLINNPEERVYINEINAKIKYCTFTFDKNLNKAQIKDIDLYPEESYFSKSPRLRRFIETKEIKLDPPPRDNNNNGDSMLMTIGPMITMSLTSIIMLSSTISNISAGKTTFEESKTQIFTGIAMVMSSLLWPIVTKIYEKHKAKKSAQELLEKYTKYLTEKETELLNEKKLQQSILIENLISLTECINMINTRGTLFWNKRSDENDFLTVRIGIGNAKLDVDVKYPEEGFTIDEDELRKQADALVEKYKYIQNVPIGYSFQENKVTAIMGNSRKSSTFVNNMLLQLLTFYSYEELKIVVITSEEKEHYWDYIKYLNHNFTNNKDFRLFASTKETIKTLSDFLNYEVNNRISFVSENNGNSKDIKPYYLIILDNYKEVKRFDFIKNITESENDLGFSIIIVENSLSKLPSKCNNFISLTGKQSGVLKNTYESQEQIIFNDEVNYNINMMDVVKVLANIPIEFAEGIKQLPDAINFLEMEKVGKIEQLNILNRWNTNDPISSIKAEVGVDELGNLMYLDLHEKYHGPHGLIAGTTGSGKSEFIITYILSMAMNYSPEYVSFILIDYKGGGLAGAFENKVTGISLPHLAGTITNLDKAEMDRTLVSIDSEVKKRQAMFNEARDNLGESTIDIYKYERFYREGKLKEPIPHLFIICDEFAELKAQQPDFMDNLISVARIGRSLGVHLILATQKPSGVVNDQIWSNTKFRVCLKVADAADSKEMLKRPEAAYIKQAGRFYLQVGMDEIFALGQSGWCGAKYYPSNQIVKQVDKSVNFINDNGQFIKSIQASSGPKAEAQGEQLAAVLKGIIDVANKTGKKARRLWLDNIPALITIENTAKKYNIKSTPFEIKAILGEYDAPEKQVQGILEYNLLEDGNCVIYGIDSGEKEMLISTIMYSTIISHSPDEINYYLLDYGSESLRKFGSFPQVGGMVFAGEDEKFKNFIKLIREEIKIRKNLFADYGGEYKNYINNSNKKLPLMIIILNNFDSIYENNQDMYDYLPELVRDSERYGIIFIATCNANGTMPNKIAQNFKQIYAFKIKDPTEYLTMFNTRQKTTPRDIIGRGLVNNDGLHEFQTASIIEDENKLNDYLIKLSREMKEKYQTKAKRIPILPEIVSYDIVKDDITSIASVPIGISKQELEIVNFDFTINVGTIITSNKLTNITDFLKSLCYEFSQMKDTDTIFIDGNKKIPVISKIITNYYNNSFDDLVPKLKTYYEEIGSKEIKRYQILIIYAIDKFITKLSNKTDFENLITLISKNEYTKVIILDDVGKLKTYAYEGWFTKGFSSTDGIWIGKGISDQNIFRISMLKKENMIEIKNNYGLIIQESSADMIKLIEFYKSGEQDEK